MLAGLEGDDPHRDSEAATISISNMTIATQDPRNWDIRFQIPCPRTANWKGIEEAYRLDRKPILLDELKAPRMEH